ncbi:MAG: uracil-DNA glycosylase family protein [Tepidiformaceae bacterium]
MGATSGVFEAAAACRRCAEVAPGSAVLGPGNGPVPCDWLFVGEAPGRLGAARTGVPFKGDRAGGRFEALLAEAGLMRTEVFVTNAVLCLPLGVAAKNRTPTTAEIRACAGHLTAVVEVVRPRVVVTMGAVALAAMGMVASHGLRLREAAGQAVPWNGLLLAPLYHPGWRAEVHRPWAAQVADWRALRAPTANWAATASSP